ncbi:MAG TPA: RidA family protein, partial [Burkholderiales bacterium]|nr:RidA family protein [Burkholderiales bacterium]
SPRTPMPPTATPAKVQHLEATDFQKSRGFSPAVITEGGKTVWLAGQTTVTDLEGKDISGKFDEQARTIFALINRTLERAGGSLANMVTMTVFINDARYGDRFVAIRREHFPDGRYPCSALLTISSFARPGILIEIQGVAVI